MQCGYGFKFYLLEAGSGKTESMMKHINKCLKFSTTERLSIQRKVEPALSFAISKASTVSANSSASRDIRQFSITNKPFPQATAFDLEVCQLYY